jgi:hypothetical protein
MTQEEYKTEWRERDARLAVTMATHRWYRYPAGNLPSCTNTLWPTSYKPGADWEQIKHPESGKIDYGGAPYFHQSHEAKAALLAWLAMRPVETITEFHRLLVMRLDLDGHLRQNYWDAKTLIAFQMATPAQIAEAADQAIRERKEEK